MRERIILDDPTGINEKAKQEPLDIILSNINNMLLHGQQDSIVNEIVRDLSLRDIEDYLKRLITNQDLFPKIPLLTSFSVNDLTLFNALCEYTDVYKVEFPKKGSQQIYFIESADFAISIIPIELDNNEINIHIEPLEDSPDFITEIWANIKDGERIEDIEFIDYRTLQPSNKG
jgi:hypothetical protein